MEREGWDGWVRTDQNQTTPFFLKRRVVPFAPVLFSYKEREREMARDGVDLFFYNAWEAGGG